MEKWLLNFYEQSEDFLCVLSSDGIFFHLNENWEKILGWSYDDLKSKSAEEFIHPQDKTAFQIALSKINKHNPSTKLEVRFSSKNGEYKWLSWFSKINQQENIITIAKDISEQKLTLQNLIENEQIISAVLQNLPIAIFGKDIKKEFRWNLWNRAAEDLFGIKAIDGIGKYDHDFFPKEQADFFRKMDIEASKSKNIIVIPEEPAQTAKGLRILRTKKVVIRDNDGTPSILLGLTDDITEQKKLIEEIKLAKERLAIAIAAVDFGVWEWNFGSLIWDENMYKIFGANTDQVASEVYEKKVVATDMHRIKEELIQAAREKREYIQTEFRIQKSNSDFRHISTAAKCFYGASGEIERLVGVSYDETEKKQAAATIMFSAKMASLGEMAAGIAHEINNPLAIIIGKVSQLKNNIDSLDIDLPKMREGLNRIEITTDRIAKIIRGLKSFSRNSESDPMEIISVAQIIEDTMEMCAEKFRIRKIKFNLTQQPNLRITCRPTQITQVLINLLSNSYDAIESLPDKWVSLDISTDSKFVFIRISDSGFGIPHEIVEKMMQPFFTTKEVGKGTGLGLSISKGIAEEHNGTLRYDSGSKNTSFILTLPKTE